MVYRLLRYVAAGAIALIVGWLTNKFEAWHDMHLYNGQLPLGPAGQVYMSVVVGLLTAMSFLFSTSRKSKSDT